MMKMSQPTQDTDVTSSISFLLDVSNDRFNEKLRKENDVGKLAQERRPTSLSTEKFYTDNKNAENNEMAEYQGSEFVKSSVETFPWLVKFSKVIQSAVGSRNPKFLDRLLFVYIENMSRDVNTCYTKPHRAAKVKTHINNTLIFFHLYWRNIKERVDDRNQYLDKMSEILGMYVDMELKASRRGKDSASKIAAKLLTAMFIYLDNSEEHIIRSLFRAKFVTKNYSQICGPIFKKLFTGLSGGRRSITDVTYVRYLLTLKLWKKLKDDLQEKKKINELAIAILGQSTPLMNTELSKIISKPTDICKNETLWLLQPNAFDLRKACDLFVQYEINERTIPLPESVERLKIMDSVDTPPMQISLESIDRLQRKEILEPDKSLDGEQRVKKVIKLRRFKPSFPKLRPGEVVFIDLTAENDESKQRDVKKKKKTNKNKLKWLKEVSKKSKPKKQGKSAKESWVKETGVHSAENTNVGSERTANDWPISEDKITESTACVQRFTKKTYENSEDVVTSQTSSPRNTDSTVFTVSEYTKEEFYTADAALREVFLNRIKEEPNDSRAHSSTIISESFGSYHTTDENERGLINKMIKQERRDDVIDDSTTTKNCDKVILKDLSSFNVTKIPVTKLKAGENNPEIVDIQSKSDKKSIIYSSPTRGKAAKFKERILETCVVSTTASVFDSEQINVISGSTNENSSQIFNLNKNTALNSERVFQTSKILKFGETNDNHAVNNKLQNSLIHALSLDEMMQIGKDDVDSQSDNDEDKEIHKIQCKKFTTVKDDNDSFQIPELHLCDELTNSNDVKSFVAPGVKNKVDEFENIDILDSILNGDMSMQDILEEHQHLSVNSANNDLSNNMLGFFTEFFKQSEITPNNKKDCQNEETLRQDEVFKSLPEGSLGMTGILNSLLDSDLTSIDSPPSDFMYSNVQSVDPRLIRKSPTAERATFLSDFGTVSDLFSQKEQTANEDFTSVESLSKKTKDQLFLDHKDGLNCTDLEEFGLNDTKETAFQMPVLEEELIQLPPDPLIDETMITPTSCESPQSEVKSTENYDNIQLTENGYDYSKLSNFHEFASLRMKDIIQHSPNGMIDHREDLPTSTLTDFTPPQSVDPPHSPYTFAISSPAQSQTYAQVPHSPTHAVCTNRHGILTNLLTPPPSVPQSMRQNNLTPPPTPQQHGQNEVANLEKNRIRYLNSHCGKDEFLTRREFASTFSLQKKENREFTRCETERRNNGAASDKNNDGVKTTSDEIENEEDQGVCLTKVQAALTRLAREEINGRAGGERSLLKKSNILINRDTTQKQFDNPKRLQRIDLRDFAINSQQNKSVLINLNGKTMPALVFDRNINAKVDDVNMSSSNIVYKLNSNIKPATSNDITPYSKLKNVNFTVKNQIQNSKSTVTKCNGNVETTEETTQKIIRPRCSTRRVKTQANKTTAMEIGTRKNFNASNNEEPSMKKRKIANDFLPLLKKDEIIYAVNQEKTQEKHPNVRRRDFSRKERTKKKVV